MLHSKLGHSYSNAFRRCQIINDISNSKVEIVHCGLTSISKNKKTDRVSASVERQI